MDKREKYEYSIITYSPNKIRNERINIGALFASVAGSDISLKIIDKHSNQKLRSLVLNKYDQKLYDSAISYLKFCIDKINENDLSFSNENTPLKSILDLSTKGELPDEIILNSIQPFVTANFNTICSKVIDTYIGEEFFKEVISQPISLKDHVYKVFKTKKLINTKVKPHFSLRPNKQIPWKMQVDFAYAKNESLNLLQLVPDTENILDTWYPKIKTFTDTFENDSDEIYIIFDSSTALNYDHRVTQMTNSIKSENNNVSLVDLSINTQLDDLTNAIESSADSVDNLNKLLTLRTA
jgi:hypothetical protein